MSVGEIGYLISKWLIYLGLAAASIYGLYAIYYAYFKTKDERQKHIILLSVANAFSILLIINIAYYFVEIVVKYAGVAELSRLWSLLHFSLESSSGAITTASNMMAILGICLFINKRKAGGD